jgi:predicted nucleic acid-binding protein
MIILDASTLILLAKIEILETFLLNFPGRVCIPERVQGEACWKKAEETVLIERLIHEKKIHVVRAKDHRLTKKLMEDFHVNGGEAEAVTLALQEKASIVATDDRNAIRACKCLKIDFTTAIAILIRSVERNLLDQDEAFIKLKKLKSIARYSRTIIEDARKRIEGGGSHG